MIVQTIFSRLVKYMVTNRSIYYFFCIFVYKLIRYDKDNCSIKSQGWGW